MLSARSASAAEDAQPICRCAAVRAPQAAAVRERGYRRSIDRLGCDVDGLRRLCPASPWRRQPRQSDPTIGYFWPGVTTYGRDQSIDDTGATRLAARKYERAVARPSTGAILYARSCTTPVCAPAAGLPVERSRSRARGRASVPPYPGRVAERAKLAVCTLELRLDSTPVQGGR